MRTRVTLVALYNFTRKLRAKHFPKTIKILWKIKYIWRRQRGILVQLAVTATTTAKLIHIISEYSLRLKIRLKQKVFILTTAFVSLGIYYFRQYLDIISEIPQNNAIGMGWFFLFVWVLLSCYSFTNNHKRHSTSCIQFCHVFLKKVRFKQIFHLMLCNIFLRMVCVHRL